MIFRDQPVVKSRLTSSSCYGHLKHEISPAYFFSKYNSKLNKNSTTLPKCQKTHKMKTKIPKNLV